MEFLKPALIFTALSCAVLSGSFLYVWTVYTSRRYTLLWGLAWLSAIPHLACAWVLIDAPRLRGFAIADQLLLVLNAFFMVGGCCDFLYRRLPLRRLLLIALPFVAWGVIAPLQSASFFKDQLPNALLLGGSYLWTAFAFERAHRTRGMRGGRLVAILFAIAGLHELDYPLFGDLPWAAPFGFTLASVLAMTIAIALLILVLEEWRAEVEEQRARLTGILDALPVGVVMFDASGRAALDNRAGRDMIGTGASPLTVPELAARLLTPVDGVASLAPSPMGHVMRTGESSKPREFDLLDAAGSRRSVLVNAGPVVDAQARPVGVVTVLQDVRDLKEIERTMMRTERLQALGTLAAGVAHNFNNALTIILGQAEMLRRRVPAGPDRERLDSIRQVAADSVEMVGRVQDLARSRATHTETVALDLGRLVQDVIELARPRWKEDAGQRGVRYEVETRLQTGLEVEGSPPELREAVLNLVINALDAMPQGGTLRLSATPEGEEAVLVVADDGVGMPAHVRERVFDPFFTTKGARGTGLGLSLVFGVVQRHSGRISVESRAGAGTVFTIHLPLASGAPRTAKISKARVPSRRVLVVEDDPVTRQLLVDMLESQGHRPVAAPSGVAANTMMEGGEFDLVFTDLAMPDVSGWEIAAHAATVRPDLPVVLVTGWGQAISADECERRNVAGVLSKPFTLEELSRAMTIVPLRRAS